MTVVTMTAKECLVRQEDPMRRVITRSDVDRQLTLAGQPTPAPPPPTIPDDYWTRLQKLIPAEVVAAFMAIDGVVQAHVGIPAYGYWIIYGILVVLCLLYARKAATTPQLGTNRAQVVIALVAFLVWTYAIGGPYSYAGLDWWIRPLGCVLVVLLTTAAPLFVE
jgi:hypothetical protein